MKAILKEIILEFHRDALPVIFKRDFEFPQLPLNVRKAIVLIGMRRVGKTFLLYQHMQAALSRGVNKERLLYINFEDDRLQGFSSQDFQTLLDVYFELYPTYANTNNLFFYFDEIQNIEGWEQFIRRLIDKEKMEIYITGSSSKLLSREIATSLRGRSLSYEVFPLGFVEYLHHLGVHPPKHLTNKDKAILRHHCTNYLKHGGFPETLALPDTLRHKTIQSYVNAAVFRDVIDRHKITNPHVVKLFLTQCLQTIAAPLSVNKVYNSLKSMGESVGRNSLYEYLDYFEDAYLLCKVSIFQFSTRKRHGHPSKIYCVDSGIITGYSIKRETEHSACLENAVYVHLRTGNYENIFYHKTMSGKQVDFVAQKINGKLDVYQVCLNLSEEKTRQREIQSLVEAAKELEVNEGWIITNDTAEILEIDSIKITVIPYWAWVLRSSEA